MTARVQRRLAAVLAADMVGYSSSIERDEYGTITRFKQVVKEIFEPRLEVFGGRIVKTMGDGLLVEFASAVDAVECAINLQSLLTRRNTTVPPEQQIEFRMGINVGDIIIDGDDILGDGVNVASRLENLAPPGGLVISDIVYRNVLGKIEVRFTDLGSQNLKNIAKAIQAFVAVLDESPEEAAAATSKAAAQSAEDREKSANARPEHDGSDGDAATREPATVEPIRATTLSGNDPRYQRGFATGASIGLAGIAIVVALGWMFWPMMMGHDESSTDGREVASVAGSTAGSQPAPPEPDDIGAVPGVPPEPDNVANAANGQATGNRTAAPATGSESASRPAPRRNTDDLPRARSTPLQDHGLAGRPLETTDATSIRVQPESEAGATAATNPATASETSAATEENPVAETIAPPESAGGPNNPNVTASLDGTTTPDGGAELTEAASAPPSCQRQHAGNVVRLGGTAEDTTAPTANSQDCTAGRLFFGAGGANRWEPVDIDGAPFMVRDVKSTTTARGPLLATIDMDDRLVLVYSRAPRRVVTSGGDRNALVATETNGEPMRVASIRRLANGGNLSWGGTLQLEVTTTDGRTCTIAAGPDGLFAWRQWTC